MVGYSGATRKVADMLKFPRKKVGEQGKRNRKEGKREECNEGRDGEEGKGSWGEREWDLFGRYIEKEGESTGADPAENLTYAQTGVWGRSPQKNFLGPRPF